MKDKEKIQLLEEIKRLDYFSLYLHNVHNLVLIEVTCVFRRRTNSEEIALAVYRNLSQIHVMKNNLAPLFTFIIPL